MALNLEYKDALKLVTTTLSSDGYGTEIIDEIYEINGLFLSNTGWQHSSFQTAITSDAEVYLDHEDEFVINNAYRLEGMYVIANRFDGDEEQEWYQIAQVVIGEDKLLDNEINNVNCQLKKVSEVPSVS